MQSTQTKKLVYITRQVPEPAVSMLREKGYEVFVGTSDRPPTKKEVIKALRKRPYDAVLCLLTDQIDADVFDAAPQAKIFANYAVGFNNIDITEAKKRGIHVTNTPGTLMDDAVADHTIALMLAVVNRIVEGDRFVRAKKYRGWSPTLYLGSLLEGKTLGLVGLGRIGSSVAKRARLGFGMNILYHDLHENKEVEEKFQAKRSGSVEELLKTADVVSLHVPLLPETTHLINKERLSMMKPTAYLINTARGPVVDEKALLDSLKNEVIAGAALDVFEFEPKLVRGLARLKNAVFTPHIASATKEVREEMSQMAASNIVAVLEGGSPIHPAS